MGNLSVSASTRCSGESGNRAPRAVESSLCIFSSLLGVILKNRLGVWDQGEGRPYRAKLQEALTLTC